MNNYNEDNNNEKAEDSSVDIKKLQILKEKLHIYSYLNCKILLVNVHKKYY